MTTQHSLLQELFSREERAPQSVSDVLCQTSFLSKLRRYEAHHGKDFGAMDGELQDALIFPRLRQIVATLLVNPEWKARLREFGRDPIPESFEDWQSLPLTDRDALNDLYMGERRGQVVPLSHGGFEIIASGGTSLGLPIETVYSLQELRDTYALSGDFMDRFIFRRFLKGDLPKWVVMTLSDNDMWSSGTMIGGVLQNAGSVNFIAAGPMSKTVYNHILSFPGSKAIMGMSREIEALVDLGHDCDPAFRESFELAIYGSGLLQNKKVNELKTRHPRLQVLSYFASNQAEAIAMQLAPGAPLTAVPGLHMIEIVDENGRWVEEGQEGELVITRLHATAAPILRVKLGDRMIRRPSLRSESLHAMQMEFAGRSGDIIHIGETHYAALKVLHCLNEILREKGFDLDSRANEIQFLNNRRDRILTLYIGVENPAASGEEFREKIDNNEINKYFITALSSSLPIYDQNEYHFEALGKLDYTFRFRVVDCRSDQIYRTKVNKVPLIKDVI